MSTTVSEETVERLLAEGARPISQLAAEIRGERGQHVSAWTLLRWIKHGKRGVRLEAFQGTGKGWQSSLKALARFFAHLSGQVESTPTASQQRRRAEAARERMRRKR